MSCHRHRGCCSPPGAPQPAARFFRKGKLGLKNAIKIPFFVEIEVAFETDWNRRR